MKTFKNLINLIFGRKIKHLNNLFSPQGHKNIKGGDAT